MISLLAPIVVPHMQPLAYKHIPKWNSPQGRYLFPSETVASTKAQIEEAPGWGGCYPAYSLVEDTEL